MAKKAVKKAGGVLEQLAAYSPPWEDDDEDKGKKDEPSITDLMQKFNAQQAELESLKRERAFNSFQSAPVVPQAGQGGGQAPVKNVVDLKGLPDPVSETDKWQGELASRVNAAMDAREQAIRVETAAQAEQERLGNNLWDGFKKAHPEWAEHQMAVAAAAQQVNQGLINKKVDVVSLMQQQPDLFYKEIVEVLDKNFAPLKGKKDEEETEEEGPAQVFGGSPGKAGGLLEAGQDMEQDNKAWMREMGEWRVKTGLR